MAAIESAIALPFRVDSYGNIVKTYDQSKIWADRVRAVIGTLRGERVMRSRYGTKVPMSTFSNSDIAVSDISKEVRTAFASFLPQLNLDQVNVYLDDDSSVITVEVVYSLPNQTVVTTSVGVAYISGNKLLSEVN